jgi:hypothetical protein
VVAGWLAIFVSTGSVEVWGARIHLAFAGIGMMVLGTMVFLLRAKIQREWPFA